MLFQLMNGSNATAANSTTWTVIDQGEPRIWSRTLPSWRSATVATPT